MTDSTRARDAGVRLNLAHDVPKLTVTGLAYVPAREIFDVLRTPSLHADLDPKGMILSVDPASSDPITEVGQTFTMNMFAERMGGEYRMTNTVVVYDEGRSIGWQPATEGYPPLGFQWTWSVREREAEVTEVTLTYDWLAVTHRGFLAKNTFPMFPESSFVESVDALIAFVEADWGDDNDEVLS